MALRYELPNVNLSEPGLATLLSVPQYRAPGLLEFRRSSDSQALVEKILLEPRGRICAAVGSGKSVVLPSMLALQSKKLVFHIVPNPMLAVDLFTYVNKLAAERSDRYPVLTLMDAPYVELPKRGLVIAGASTVVARMLSGDKAFLSGAIVYLDEAHESDAYTHVLRNLAPELGSTAMYLASATFDADDFLTRETPGSFSSHLFAESVAMRDWHPEDPGKPWSTSKLNGNAAIFSDSETVFKSVHSNYTSCGYLVFRLHAKMSRDEFVAAMAALRDRHGPIVILVADSSFRSGFTFDVQYIFDSGEIGYTAVADDGGVVRRYRKIYAFEAEQTAGRGARTPGSRCQYWRPPGELQQSICDLAGVEKEAASYFFRLLGYKSTGPLRGCLMETHALDADPIVVLNGPYPLAVCKMRPLDKLVDGERPAVSPDKKPTGAKVVEDDVVEEVPRSPEFHRDNPSVVEDSSTLNDFDFARKTLQTMLDATDRSVIRTGKCYMTDGCVKAPDMSMTFPDGPFSVLRMATGSRFREVVEGMSREDRMHGLSIALKEYNHRNLDLIALRLALNALPADGVKRRGFGTFVKELLEHAATLFADLNNFKRAAKHFMGRDLDIHELKDVKDLVASRSAAYSAQLQRFVGVPVADGDIEAYKSMMRGRASLEEGGKGYLSPPPPYYESVAADYGRARELTSDAHARRRRASEARALSRRSRSDAPPAAAYAFSGWHTVESGGYGDFGSGTYVRTGFYFNMQ